MKPSLDISMSALDEAIGHTEKHLTGLAIVIDGDTIRVAGERVRLHGIDAPELDQTFWCQGMQLACGAMALAALEALTAGVKLRCEIIERDRYGRLVAKCFSSNGIDIGRRLVSAGWALAYRRYSMDYVDAENEARGAKRGMWRGTFKKPWEWRASSLQRVTPTSSPRSPGGAGADPRRKGLARGRAGC